MAIVKNNCRVSRLEGEFSSVSRDSMSSDEDVPQRWSSESDEDDDQDDADSGAGSDDIDLSELEVFGEEFCQVGNQTCSIPCELYDLPSLGEILSVDVWNNCLTEEERFSLVEYLPDMDQDTFMRTLKELFSCGNFHFGSPLVKLFDMLKGGLCEPRVALYHQGLNFVQKHTHYHRLRMYQNNLVGNLVQIKDAWENCMGYSIEERLRVLNLTRSQRGLMYENMEDLGLETDSSGREEYDEGFWNKRLKETTIGSKMGRRAAYAVNSTGDVFSRERAMMLEPAKYGKQNPKGILKLAGSKDPPAKGLISRFPYNYHGLETKSRLQASMLTVPRQKPVVGHGLGASYRARNQIRGEDDAEEQAYEMAIQKDRNAVRGSTVAKAALLKPGKKREFLKSENGFATESSVGLSSSLKKDALHFQGKNWNVDQMADVKMSTAKLDRTSVNYHSRDSKKKAKYFDTLQQPAVQNMVNTAKDRAQHLLSKGNRVDLSSGNQPFRRNNTQEETFSVDRTVTYDDLDVGSKKWNVRQEFQTSSKNLSSDAKVKYSRSYPSQMNDTLSHSNHRFKTKQEETKREYMHNGGLDMKELRGVHMFAHSDETETDSSEQEEEEEYVTPLRSNVGYPSDGLEGHQHAAFKSVPDAIKANKLVKKGKQEYGQALDRVISSSRKVDDFGEQLPLPEGAYSLRAKHTGKVLDPSYSLKCANGILEDSNISGRAKLANDSRNKAHKSVKNGQNPLLKAYPSERKKKRIVDQDYSVPQSNYINDCIGDDEDGFNETPRFMDDCVSNGLGKKGQMCEAQGIDLRERPNLSLSECNSVTKKRKVKVDMTYVDVPDESEDLHSGPQRQVDDLPALKKWSKRKVEAKSGSLATMVTSENGFTDVDPETKSTKRPFTLITPTIPTGFSFSIIHLLSAVRLAMITPLADVSVVGKHLEKSDERHKPKHETQNGKHEMVKGVAPADFHENMDASISECTERKNLPSLTVQEIVNCVRSNPGDPCILETAEPLQDLVRGVLKIFSSKTAPLGAKGWKALTFYEKSTKSWSWIGPVSSSSLDPDAVEEVTSPEAWGLPHKMLVKLVDSFANWLKSGQETLQQIGSLPPPPLMLMQPNLDEKERFRDLRAQKSLTTISPSCEEVKAYFRREEVLRYSVPDRAFSYTAADGRKSIVAPLRRCGGKLTSKARDHFMLKPDRPPHVTVLCLVRDAAARLPGSIGTRADVCTLIRDSQFIVEDVSDAQINQVVSGALDRLHYERDPCVQFDGERKLWVYLHRDREEEDFEDDGTSSTKKWKRQRKDPAEQSNPGMVNDAYHGTREQIAGGSDAAYELGSDVNIEPSSTHGGGEMELVYNNPRNGEEDTEPFFGSLRDNAHEGHPIGWKVLGLNSLQERRMLCQENSTNEDFDDGTFSRDRHAGPYFL